MSAEMLEQELKTYEDRLAELSASDGKFVLIQGDDVDGIYDTYEDALKVGYGKFGLKPFLIKQIAQTERILSFTRDYEFVCQA